MQDDEDRPSPSFSASLHGFHRSHNLSRLLPQHWDLQLPQTSAWLDLTSFDQLCPAAVLTTHFLCPLSALYLLGVSLHHQVHQAVEVCWESRWSEAPEVLHHDLFSGSVRAADGRGDQRDKSQGECRYFNRINPVMVSVFASFLSTLSVFVLFWLILSPLSPCRNMCSFPTLRRWNHQRIYRIWGFDSCSHLSTCCQRYKNNN